MIFLLKTQSSEDKIFQIDDSTTIYGNKLKTLFGERGTIILNSIAAQPRTIKELAFETGLSQQAIYYHIKKFEDLGIISYQEELEKFTNTTVKTHRYFLYSNKLTINLLSEKSEVKGKNQQKINGFLPLPKFLQFIGFNRTLAGYLVVGSSIAHGKYNATAQDGHFVGYVANLLGIYGLTNIVSSFIKLDTEVNKENLKKENLILIGGPKVNVITAELQELNRLPVSFEIEKINTISIKESLKVISDPLIGVIQIISNPWVKNSGKKILILAGPSRIGTQITVFTLLKYTLEVDTRLQSGKNYLLIQGKLDNNGDLIDVVLDKF